MQKGLICQGCNFVTWLGVYGDLQRCKMQGVLEPYPRKTGKDGRPHGGDKGADLVQGLDSLLVEVLDGGDASRRDLLRLEVHKGVVVVGSLEVVQVDPALIVHVFQLTPEP